MKEVFVPKNELLSLNVRNMGIEENSKDAHWGKGRRIFYILQYILSGKGYFNGREVRAGQGFFVQPNELHEYHSSEDEPWTYFWVNLSGERVGEICQKYIGETAGGIFEYDFRTNLLDVAVEAVRSACSATDRAQISSARALAYFWRIMSYHESSMDEDKNRYVRDAKNYMRLHFHEPLSITDIARTMNISDRYLYNLFVKEEGLSPKQHLNGLRVARAVKMLKWTDATISEIAVSVGVPDVLTFSRFFKNIVGVSPSAFRADSRRADKPNDDGEA